MLTGGGQVSLFVFSWGIGVIGERGDSFGTLLSTGSSRSSPTPSARQASTRASAPSGCLTSRPADTSPCKQPIAPPPLDRRPSAKARRLTGFPSRTNLPSGYHILASAISRSRSPSSAKDSWATAGDPPNQSAGNLISLRLATTASSCTCQMVPQGGLPRPSFAGGFRFR